MFEYVTRKAIGLTCTMAKIWRSPSSMVRRRSFDIVTRVISRSSSRRQNTLLSSSVVASLGTCCGFAGTLRESKSVLRRLSISPPCRTPPGKLLDSKNTSSSANNESLFELSERIQFDQSLIRHKNLTAPNSGHNIFRSPLRVAPLSTDVAVEALYRDVFSTSSKNWHSEVGRP